jgi:gluconate 2-dehydrogenase gamma chain
MFRLSRRQFCEHALVGVGVGAGATAALAALGCRTHAGESVSAADAAPSPVDSPLPSLPQPKTLTVAEFATLAAVCERLLPRDQDPGARDLGVPTYIDAMVATPELAPVHEMLLKVLPILDKESRKRFSSKDFAEIAPADQDAILDTWQHGSESRQHFFDVILSLTLEGAFGDPKYGGNLGGRGFAMIGFTPDLPLKKMAPMPTHQHVPG